MIRCFILFLCSLVVASCVSDPTVGYSNSSLYPSAYHSVSVPIFQNNTMDRNIEFMLTDAVIKEIQTRTPYIVANEFTADTQLTGTITSVQRKTISQSRTTGLDNEVLLKVVIDFEWLSLAGGGTILSRKNFANSAVFIPSRPSFEPMEVGQFAVVQQLASDIVDQMQASW